MDAVLFVVIGVSAILVFDLAAVLWGADTTERFDSPEWERRRTWPQRTPLDKW